MFQISFIFTTKIPPKWARIGIFQPNAQNLKKLAYYRNHSTDSNQILQSCKDHQILFVRGPNTRITQIQDDGRPPS